MVHWGNISPVLSCSLLANWQSYGRNDLVQLQLQSFSDEVRILNSSKVMCGSAVNSRRKLHFQFFLQPHSTAVIPEPPQQRQDYCGAPYVTVILFDKKIKYSPLWGYRDLHYNNHRWTTATSSTLLRQIRHKRANYFFHTGSQSLQAPPVPNGSIMWG